MTTRILTPAQAALKKGIVPFLRHMWEHETVVAVSVLVGITPLIVYAAVPKSRKERYGAYIESMPHTYPKVTRYEEGKTDPPTVV